MPENNLVNPFVESAKQFFKVMLRIEISNEQPFLKEGQGEPAYISGMVGFAGEYIGNMALRFNREPVPRIVNRFIGETKKECDCDINDAVGEMANIIAGGGKNRLCADGYNFGISLPLVLESEGHKLSPIKNIPCYIIKFHSELGDFWIELSLKKKNGL